MVVDIRACPRWDSGRSKGYVPEGQMLHTRRRQSCDYPCVTFSALVARQYHDIHTRGFLSIDQMGTALVQGTLRIGDSHCIIYIWVTGVVESTKTTMEITQPKYSLCKDPRLYTFSNVHYLCVPLKHSDRLYHSARFRTSSVHGNVIVLRENFTSTWGTQAETQEHVP